MTRWIFASQLLLIAVLNVHCFPAKKEWRQHHPKDADSSHLDSRTVLRYVSPPAVPAPPTHFKPVGKEYSSPDPYPASSSSIPHTFSGVPNWSPVEKSTYTVSRASPPRPAAGLLPPPPVYEPGELELYEENVEHGNSERESEELSGMPPPPPPPPYPKLFYQPGDLYEYSAIFDHGNSERETEDQGFRPPSYAEVGVSTSESSSSGHVQPVPQHLTSFGPNRHHYFLFLSGQLPPGTLSHFLMENENGADHWNEVYYERYHYPSAQSLTQAPVPVQLQQKPQTSKV
ncbi:extensin-2-like [Mugil cephalus]|uniref:extensin-2-like n=1 Tax=Mugil cephalus TaxID=48193 RepID=UPI001FB767AC|nr:extensin-2-like [Mugil cephalus]